MLVYVQNFVKNSWSTFKAVTLIVYQVVFCINQIKFCFCCMIMKNIFIHFGDVKFCYYLKLISFTWLFKCLVLAGNAIF